VIAAVPWSPLWQGLLDALGWVVAQIYALIPNYGVTIIALTVLVRVVLLPLGIKQIRSMQHMQIVQPKIKQVQQKYKQNKQKQQEEVMKLYKEYGVNPFSGCWPVLLQFPILIAMYSVLRWPQSPVHIPQGTDLYNVIQQQIPEPPTPDKMAELPGPPAGTSFLGMNLLCSAMNAGRSDASLTGSLNGEKVVYPVDCGSKAIARVPYYAFALLMFGTTYFQQRQMQKASPPGAASQQQQTLMKIMPIMFGVFGIFFPAGLVLYWTTSNAWQIGQQYYMLRTRPTAEALAERAAQNQGKPAKKGFMSSMMERAQDEQKRRQPGAGKPGTPPQRKPSSSPKPSTGRSTPRKGGSSSQPPTGGKPTKPKKPAPPTTPTQDSDGSGTDQRADD
jgi:YidC/Oxa1 family membrane protein insertase